ncbi:MAG: DUF1566 domain-containing protein [Spirochaetaceae bacterium]|nr:MAG: DUF1566 domain-containing protein [Spirochaetaceae bacterium]
MNTPGSTTVRAGSTAFSLRTSRTASTTVRAVLLCLLLPAALALSCSNPFVNYNDNSASDSSASSGAKTGTLSIQFGGSMLEAQTVTPNPVDPATLTYNVLLTRDGFADILVTDIADATAAVEGIALGLWYLEVTGFSGATPVFRSTPDLSVNIAEGANFLTVQLHPLTEGEGGIALSIGWPVGLVSGYDAAQSSFADLLGGPPQPIDAYTEVVGTQLNFSIPSIAAGYYRLSIYLTNIVDSVDVHVATVIEVIHVYDTLVSTANIALTTAEIAQAPSAPTGLASGYERDASQALTGVTLSWSDTANTEEGFRVFRVVNGDDPALISGNLNPNTQSYIDTDTGAFAAGDTIGYVVRAFNSFGESADLSATAGTARALTYDGNENTEGTVPATDLLYFEGEEVTVLENTGGLGRDGHSFGGWNTQADGTGENHPPGTTFDMPAANLTLYAAWNTESFTLSFIGNGSVAGDVPEPGLYEFGEEVLAPENTGDLRGPYVEEPIITQRFLGWNTAADGTGTDYPVRETFNMPAADLTLYAQWTTDAALLGKIGPAGGYVFVENPNPNWEVDDGWRWMELALADGEWGTWSAPADALIGTAAELGRGKFNTELIIANTSDSAAARSTVESLGGYSDWFLPTSAEMQQIINAIHVNGLGEFDTSGTGSYWTSHESNATNAFRGNFDEGSGNVTAQMKGNGSYTRAVRAFRSVAETYVIQYHANEADNGSAPPAQYYYEAGDTVVLSGRGDLARAGFGFAGWMTEADGSGASFLAEEALVLGTDIPAQNSVLYARWFDSYNIGDEGPAGGHIFYINPNPNWEVDDGWRFMEAAPVDTEFVNRSWGTEANLIGTAAALGEGLSNTTAVVTSLADYNGGDYAARLAADLVFDGYADWFLPSQDELIEMYQRLRVEQDVAGFENAHYWSSTEETAANAWSKSFNTGADDSYIKTNAFIRVRAARRF